MQQLDCYLELENLKERLVDYIKSDSIENVEKFNPLDLVQLQKRNERYSTNTIKTTGQIH